MSIEVRPLQSIGAEVVGLDLTRPVDPETKAQMYQAWLDYGVLLFRGMGVDAETHIALSRCFGDLEEPKALDYLKVPGRKELVEVSRAGKPLAPSYYINGRLTTGYLFWHQDLVYTPSIAKGAMLRMVQAPQEGGETGWIDTIKVYEALPEATKKKIAGLEVRMRLRVDLDGIPFGVDPSIRKASMEEAPYDMPGITSLPDVVHPLVSTHPETGCKSLCISPLTLVSILGLSKQESDELLRSLVEHTLRPEFMFIHHWQVNDMVLWDNRRTIHSTFGYPYGQVRVAQRTTLVGDLKSGRIYEEAA